MLVYSVLTSLDGYTEDEHGEFGWGAPEDEEVPAYINELASPVGTYLYGRRIYETMVYWETAHTIPNQPHFVLDWAHQWQAAEKVVYSRNLTEPRSARTRIEREIDPAAVRRLKASAGHDITVAGPELAAQAIRAGVVDAFQMIVFPVVVGGGKRFFPHGPRWSCRSRIRPSGPGTTYYWYSLVVSLWLHSVTLSRVPLPVRPIAAASPAADNEPATGFKGSRSPLSRP